METHWERIKKAWLRQGNISKDISDWAINSIEVNEAELSGLEKLLGLETVQDQMRSQIKDQIKNIRREIKIEISKKENSLDGISLNPSNSSKLQISVPSNLNYLMKAWAAAEGRDLSSVALQCLETGLRSMKSKGVIPEAAIKRYDIACEKRIALSEANNAWDKYEDFALKK